jgi:hypothetical protein
MKIGFSAKDGGRVQQAGGREQGSGEAAFVGIKDPVLIAIIPEEVIQGDAFHPAQFVHRFKRTTFGVIAQTRVTQLQGPIGAPPIHDGRGQLSGHSGQK